MVFPGTPADYQVDLKVAGAWTDITGYVLERDTVQLARGRADEAARLEASKVTMSLDNRTGRFSPRNPVGAYFGGLGRNTPLRISLPGDGNTRLRIPGATVDQASCPDTAGLSITGDLDIRVDLEMDEWRAVSAITPLAGKWVEPGDQRSWILWVNSTPKLAFAWSTAGSNATVSTATSATLPTTSGRLAVRVTLDVDNGAGGRTVTFYTAATSAGPWTVLGSPSVVAGVTSVFDSTAPVQVAGIPAPSSSPFGPTPMKVSSFQLLQGIAGTARANPDFTALANGTASFTDAAGNTWTLGGDAEITDRRYRAYAEVSEWPPKSDVAEADVYVPIEASGILRRLNAGSDPLHSAIRRATLDLALTPPVAYWPGEDGSEATVLGSALPGGLPMTYSGTPSLGAYSGYSGSDPLPLVNNSTWSGAVAPYTPTTVTRLRLRLAVPTGGMTNNAVICRLTTTGTASTWDLTYTTAGSGTLTLRGYDRDGVLLVTSTSLTFTPVLNGAEWRIYLLFTQNGANLDALLYGQNAAFGDGNSSLDTVAGRTMGMVTRVDIDPTANINDTAIGHIDIRTDGTYAENFGTPDPEGHTGESADARIRRLCSEEGIPFKLAGVSGDGALMGPQTSQPLLDLINECVEADGGLLFEPRDVLGLGFRPLKSLYNQDPQAALDYAAGHLPPLEPTDDDQLIRNDITVSRPSGSSARAELEDGPLSTQAPPDGIGRYPDTPTLNLASDDQLADQAWWRLHTRTVDEARFPTVRIDLGGRISADQALCDALLDHREGDRITITGGLPDYLPPDDVSLLVQGSTEELAAFIHTITLTCSPESPYRVGLTDDPVLGRADTEGSQLAAGVNATAVTLSLATTSGPLWTTDPADMPFNIRVGGEVMTVTAITGATSPQSATVVRSVNGVVKPQAANTDVRLDQPMIIGL